MRIKLLDAGGYCGLECVVFPVEVEASMFGIGGVTIHYKELVRIGASESAFFDDEDPLWFFDDEEWEPVDNAS